MNATLSVVMRRGSPANDNALTMIPMFVSLLRRHDLTRADCLVYGALVACEHAGIRHRMRDLAPMLGMNTRRLAQRINRLCDRGLVVRHGRTAPGRVTMYELRGPRIAA